MEIQVKTSWPSSRLFTQDKVYDAEALYDGDGTVRLATVVNEKGKTVSINLTGPCAYLSGEGEWRVIKCGG